MGGDEDPHPEGAGRLVGRVGERARLDRLVDGLEDGRPGLLLLVGEAGIGKSVLAQLGRRRARRRGLRTTTGRAVPLTIGQPLQPVLTALEELDDHGVEHVRSLLEATVGDPSTLLLHRTIERLDARCAEAPLLVVLEDLHWADATTLTLVHHLATRADPRPLAIVATSRPARPGTPLHHLLHGLEPAVLALDGLREPEVDELAARTGAAALSPTERAQLAGAHGNPLLVLATLEARRAAGGAAPGGAPGPIAAQIRSLAPEVLAVLRPAAVAGDALRLDVLTALTRRSSLELLELLDTAAHGGVLVHRTGGYAFRHDLYRTGVLETLPLDARAAVHLDVAAALEALGAPRLEIAEHVARGARPGNQAAVATLTAAAEELADRDPVTALAISDLAVGLLGRPDVPEALQVVRISSLATCGRSAEAELLGRSLLRGALPVETERRVRRDLALAAFVQGRSAEAELHMRAVAAMAPDAQQAARARTELAWAQFLALERAGALEGATLGRSEGDDFTRLAADSLLCWLGLWSLDIALADQAAQETEVLVGGGEPGDWQVFQPLFGAAAVRLERGELDRAVALATNGRRMAIAAGTAWAAPAYDALLATAAWRQGRLAQAETLAAAALDATAIVDGFGVEIWSRSLLAELALRRGRPQAAQHHLQAARQASQDGRAQLGTNHLVQAEAMAAAVDGDAGAALDQLREGWAFLVAIDCGYVKATVGCELVRWGVRAGVGRAELEQVAETLELDAKRSSLPMLVAEAARAQAWLDPARSADAVTTAAGSGCTLQRHDALRDALELAPTHRDAGTWRAELDALRRALDLAQPVDAAEPARARSSRGARADRPRFGPSSLTDAEQRVARLVAEGLTNAQIAARLVVSRRTVDTQVLAAYRKLGVSSRVALTRLLLELDRPPG